jgi:MraZ protein
VVFFIIYLAFKMKTVVDLTYTYECKVDNKGRVLLPGKLKQELAQELSGGFIMKRSVFSPCLELWPKEEWNKKLAEINKLNRFVKKNARFIRKFLAGVKPVELDSTGRLNIPNDLMTFANISKTVVFTSQINILEIWDKEKYEVEVAYENDDDEDFGKLAEEVMGDKKPENSES